MGGDSGLTIVAGTFVLILGIVLLVYWALLARPENVDRAKLEKRLKVATPQGSRRLHLLHEVRQMSSVGPLNALLGQVGAVARPLERAIEQSGMKTTVGVILSASFFLAMLAFFLVYRRTAQPWLAIGVAALAAIMPYQYVSIARTRRLRKFEEQFPEAVDLIARTLRAGHAFLTGLKLAAEELPEPVAGEFKLLHDRQNYGLPMPDALKSFAERVPVLDARFFVTAVLTQREAGGNLAEVLDNLSSVIRERFHVKRQVRVLSAHGRITGWILACMPPGLAAIIFIVNPGQLNMLFSDPIGVKMVTAALSLQIVGTLIIRKLTNIEY